MSGANISKLLDTWTSRLMKTFPSARSPLARRLLSVTLLMDFATLMVDCYVTSEGMSQILQDNTLNPSASYPKTLAWFSENIDKEYLCQQYEVLSGGSTFIYDKYKVRHAMYVMVRHRHKITHAYGSMVKIPYSELTDLEVACIMATYMKLLEVFNPRVRMDADDFKKSYIALIREME